MPEPPIAFDGSIWNLNASMIAFIVLLSVWSLATNLYVKEWSLKFIPLNTTAKWGLIAIPSCKSAPVAKALTPPAPTINPPNAPPILPLNAVAPVTTPAAPISVKLWSSKPNVLNLFTSLPAMSDTAPAPWLPAPNLPAAAPPISPNDLFS